MTKLRLAPSILTADFARLADDLRAVEPFVDWFHLDVMDGHYVENITFGPDVVRAIRATVSKPLHVHLMITDPERFAPKFARAGAERISFHPEVTPEPATVVAAIKDEGAGAGVAIHPDRGVEDVISLVEDLDVVVVMTVRPGWGGQAFMDDMVPKITAVGDVVQKASSHADIEIDGGVNPSTVDRAVVAGGTILVAGSAIFDGRDPAAAARRMREILDRLGER